jgi:Uma2 family endonuclease
MPPTVHRVTKAVVLPVLTGQMPDPLQAWADERTRLGHDRWDELWDGVLHMVPPPTYGHNDRGTELLVLLRPLARAAGLKLTYETGVFRPGRTDDYRQPDLVVAHPDHISTRGIEGRAELVVEIRSPYDEAWEKLPFFAEMGIPEVLILDEDRAVLLRLTSGQGYRDVPADAAGDVRSEVLLFSFRNLGGGRIVVTTPHESAEL